MIAGGQCGYKGGYRLIGASWIGDCCGNVIISRVGGCIIVVTIFIDGFDSEVGNSDFSLTISYNLELQLNRVIIMDNFISKNLNFGHIHSK